MRNRNKLFLCAVDLIQSYFSDVVNLIYNEELGKEVMALENITENTWSPTGDYGTEFKEELNSYKSKVNEQISTLQKIKSKIDTYITNSKLNEDTIDGIEVCIRKLQLISDEIDEAISSLEFL